MKKQDQKLVSKQEHEVSYISIKFGIARKIVRDVIKQVGISRRKIYTELRKRGYEIKSLINKK